LSACTIGSVDSEGIFFMRLWTDTYIETPDFVYSSDAEASSDNKVLQDLIAKIP
jgi:hypothetical protein